MQQEAMSIEERLTKIEQWIEKQERTWDKAARLKELMDNDPKFGYKQLLETDLYKEAKEKIKSYRERVDKEFGQ